MARKDTIRVNGKMVAQIRSRKGLTQLEFAEKIDSGLSTVARYEGAKKIGIPARTIRLIGELEGMDFEKIVEALGGKLPTKHNFPPLRSVPRRKVPIFRFVPADRLGGPESFYQSDLQPTDFIDAPVPSSECMVIVLDGDCMEPEYRSGDKVIIDFAATSRERLVPGLCYYIALRGEAGDEGRVSFKRFVGDEGEAHIFDCTNKAKYPLPLRLVGLFNAGVARGKL